MAASTHGPALLALGADNFRSFRKMKVELGPLNILVGPNGAGKSNLLDLIRFLRDSVLTDLQPALDSRGGYGRVYFRGETDGPMRVIVEADVTSYSHAGARDEYTLVVYNQAQHRREGRVESLRRRESFVFKRTPGRGRRIKIEGGSVETIDRDEERDSQSVEKRKLLRSDSLGLSTLPKLALGEGGDEVKKIADLFADFRVFDIDVSTARRPSRLRNDRRLEDDASNLASFLVYLRRQNGLVDQLEDDARHFVPGLDALEFQSVGGAGDAVSVLLREKGLRGRTELADASYGTIRALALLALLYDPDPPRLTCIEEIDHGLHPYVFDRLVERLREASSRTQFLIATHSPALVNRLDASELIVCERDPATGESRIPAVPPEEVAELEAELDGQYGLGELWFSGSLGGVPA